MTTLKDLRVRIKSVKSTQKITSAMKMVATAKLRKIQDRLAHSRIYAKQFKHTLKHALQNLQDLDSSPLLLTGNKTGATLILAIATNRGLCGGYNMTIVREVKALVKHIKRNANDGHDEILIAPIGRKIKNTLTRECEGKQINARLFEFKTSTDFERSTPDFDQISSLAEEILKLLETGIISNVQVVTGQLKSIISQPIAVHQLVPLPAEDEANNNFDSPFTLFEPKPEILLKMMLMHNFVVQLNTLFLENTACEHSARMTAMDNATRNARDMISNLELRYNQGRQAQITNELNEIIAGSSAV